MLNLGNPNPGRAGATWGGRSPHNLGESQEGSEIGTMRKLLAKS